MPKIYVKTVSTLYMSINGVPTSDEDFSQNFAHMQTTCAQKNRVLHVHTHEGEGCTTVWCDETPTLEHLISQAKAHGAWCSAEDYLFQIDDVSYSSVTVS